MKRAGSGTEELQSALLSELTALKSLMQGKSSTNIESTLDVFLEDV
ncbi:MAG: hypothetical protein HQ568_08575 [Calditrichaeota bacterium]|nr:hypothetical protein [Calditrichota bacterium]